MSFPLVAAGLPGVILLALLAHAVRQHGAGPLAWRWFTGHAWHGRPHTNAGWLARGDKVLHPTGRASRWQHLPRAPRAAIRTGGTLAALGAAYGLLAHRADTEHALAAAGAAAAAWGALAAWRWARGWRHNRANVAPLHHALGGVLGVPAAGRPSAWLTVPISYHKRQGAKITVRLPKRFPGGPEVQKVVEAIVCAKLTLEAPTVDWLLHGARPAVTFTVQIPPPARVRLADVGELLRKAAATAPLLGLGRAGAAVHADLDADSPHVLVSAGSGGGKSVTTRAIVAQILARGGVALILDVKRLSQAWARGLPNVRYCRSIGEIHDALIWLRDELDRRNQAADEGADEDGNTDQVDVGPRIVVLAEEMNATVNRLAAYWRTIKTKDDPNISPAIDALGDCIFMGRQVRVNVLAVAQMLTARTVGGPEARESFGCRVLARYTVNAWRVLVPEIWPMPRSTRHGGRVQVCVGGVAKETQVLFLKPREARELATSGQVATFPAQGAPRSAPAAEGVVTLAGRRPLVGLAAAVAEGVVPGGLEAVRKARQRDPEFPASRGTGNGGELLYDPAELRSWAANRPRAAAASA